MTLAAPALAPDLPPKARAILAAAEALLVQYGYRRTSMDDIAKKAGVAKGTLYLYFDSKEAVFRTLQERLHAEILAKASAAGEGRAPFADRLAAMLLALHGEMLARFGASEHVDELIEARNALDPAAVEGLKRGHLSLLERLFEAAAANGEINLRSLSPAALAGTAAAAALGAKPAHGERPDSADYARRISGIAEVIAAAVRA